MLQINFKLFFLNQILDFLWRQWSALGVAGGGRSEDTWLIDPESILVFSIRMARYEPRLFDEILDWLVINGKWIDNQRLRSVLKFKEEEMKRLVCAAAWFVADNSPVYKRKWEAVANLCKKAEHTPQIIVFKTKDGKPYPSPQKKSRYFLSYGFLREEPVIRKMTRPVNIGSSTNLRFLLRSLVGTGARSECLAYLLAHDAGHPSEIAREIGFSVKGVRDMLNDLISSGLVLTRPKGKRKLEYYLNKTRWFQFITGQNVEEVKMPLWLNWIELFAALENVWNILNKIEETQSGYMRSSKLREAMETISIEFAKSGLELPPLPGPDVKPDRYEKEFQTFITKVLGAEHEISR
ncbi:MAG: helix-turn-helix transcriptional regulator [Candidatus Omnitrophica bacterium]|nr:helix-turn-helix transcriptional regulator [Candidatus Omnitrophota bacterium]